MNKVAITIAFGRGQYEYIFEANQLPKDLVESITFNLVDYTSLDDLNNAINAKLSDLEMAEGQRLHKYYIDIVPFPRPKGFYPTGGVRWPEKAWDFYGYINNPALDDRFSIGDSVRFPNAYGHAIEASIFGFNKAGKAILDWDCYWFPKSTDTFQKIDV